MSEHCARALHVCLQELRGCDQTGLLSWGQTRRLGFGTGRGAAADTGQILRKQQEGGTKDDSLTAIVPTACKPTAIYPHSKHFVLLEMVTASQH